MTELPVYGAAGSSIFEAIANRYPAIILHPPIAPDEITLLPATWVVLAGEASWHAWREDIDIRDVGSRFGATEPTIAPTFVIAHGPGLKLMAGKNQHIRDTRRLLVESMTRIVRQQELCRRSVGPKQRGGFHPRCGEPIYREDADGVGWCAKHYESAASATRKIQWRRQQQTLL